MAIGEERGSFDDFRFADKPGRSGCRMVLRDCWMRAQEYQRHICSCTRVRHTKTFASHAPNRPCRAAFRKSVSHRTLWVSAWKTAGWSGIQPARDALIVMI